MLPVLVLSNQNLSRWNSVAIAHLRQVVTLASNHEPLQRLLEFAKVIYQTWCKQLPAVRIVIEDRWNIAWPAVGRGRAHEQPLADLAPECLEQHAVGLVEWIAEALRLIHHDEIEIRLPKRSF